MTGRDCTAWSVAVLCLAACAQEPLAEHEARLLAMHEAVLEAHRANDVAAWMALEGEDYVSANGGTISFPTAAEREAMRAPYLASASFEVYRDLRAPVVRISDDATLGWVIVEVEVRGTQRAEDGTTVPVDAIWAWIELYERVGGAWRMTGNVSNRRP